MFWGWQLGSVFGRFFSRTRARQFGEKGEKACAPFQFALSLRGPCHSAITDDPRATVLPIDGIGVYDHVLRSAMLTKLLEVPHLQGLIPWVRPFRGFVGRPSRGIGLHLSEPGLQHFVFLVPQGPGNPLTPRNTPSSRKTLSKDKDSVLHQRNILHF